MTDPRSPFAKIKYGISLVLAMGAVSVEDEMACIDTSIGKVVPGQASTTLFGIGYFREAMTGDGVAKVPIELFEGLRLHYFDNDDSPNAVVAADIGSSCYIKDARTVSHSNGGSTRSVAGIVLDIDPTEGVGVLFGLPVKGATGGSGGGVAQSVATKTALKNVAAADRADGDVVMVRADGALWRFVSGSSVATDVAEELVLIPAAGTGRWIRADKAFTLRAPIAFGNADGDKILTVPAGFVLRPTGLPYWEVTTGWTGGTASTIGVASDHAGYTTAGDILGGAAGDATATLGTAGVKPGTIGPKLDTPAEVQAFVLLAGESLTYEEITSAFTAGAGFVCFPVSFSPVG